MTRVIAKRVEIITDRMILNKLVEKLSDAGFKYYTLFPDIVGNGERGLRAADGVSGGSRNIMMILYVCEWNVDDIEAVVTPLLTRYGGIATVDDTNVLYAKHLCNIPNNKK